MTLNPTFVDFSASPPRRANASVRSSGAGDARGHWILNAGGAVWVDFAADTPSDEVTLKVCALVSKVGPAPGFAPLDILVNGQSVISRFRIPGGGDLPQVMTFAVPGEWLRSGSNTLELRSAEDSQTMLWLYRVLLESVWDRDAAERALLVDCSAESAFTFVTYSRPADASEWQSGPQLRFQIDEGQAAAPAELSWRGSDGSEAAISFAGEMTSFLGHVRTARGVWLQLRGDLTERRERSDGPAQRFRTEVNWGGTWHQSGELSVFLDTGSGPVERIGWRDQRGNTASIGLTHVGASFTGYAQRVNEGPIGYRGVIVGVPLPQESPDTPGAAEGSEHEHFYVADETAHTTDEQLLLIVDLSARDDEPAEARCVAADLWEIDANVSIGNMFISEFLGEDGVCRGML